jgi:hypothetical protein
LSRLVQVAGAFYVSGDMHPQPSLIHGKSRLSRSAWNQHSTLNRNLNMLWTIFVLLLILWVLGVVTSTTLGGFIHLLLLIAVAVVLIRIIQGRRPL